MKSVRCAIWGKEGSGKSTMALTFPKPISHFDIDVGGYDRAIWRIDEADIKSTSYAIPIQKEKLMGASKEGAGTTIRFPRQVVGQKELWQRIVTDYIRDCQNPKIKTIIIDSATQLWFICHQGKLQEKQEIQLSKGMKVEDDRFREKLQPVEYPNDRMRDLIYAAKGYDKNLVVTHYPRNIYKERFGSNGKVVTFKSDDIEPDGFKDTSKLVDVVFWTYTEIDSSTKKVLGRAKITIKCGIPGLGMTAVGLELPSPTYEGIIQAKEAMEG